MRTLVLLAVTSITSLGPALSWTFAADALQCGVPVTGSISVLAEEDCYIFQGTAGDAVSIQLTDTSAVQARMDVFAPSAPFTPVIDAVDGIQDLVLEETGTYQILVYDRGNDATGDYALSLEWIFPAARRCPDTMPACGMLGADSIDTLGELDIFTFDGNSGDVVSIRLSNSSNIEARLDLIPPSGTLLPVLIGSSGLLDVELPENGTYVVRIYDQGLNETGTYTFALDWLTPVGKQCNTPTPLTCGSNLSTAIDNVGELDLYFFTGDVGNVVSLRLTNNSSIEARLDLFGPSSMTTPILEQVSEFQDVMLPETGTYVVRVYDIGLNEVGGYFLGFDFLRPFSKHCGPVGSLSCGVDVDGDITALGETDYFGFQGSSGEVLVLDLDNAPLSPVGATMDVFGPDGSATPVLQNGQRVVQLNLEDGEYIFRIFDDSFPETGGYNMKVDCQGDVMLSCDESVNSSISAPGELDLYTLAGTAGEVVVITLTGQSAIEARFDLFLPSDPGTAFLTEIGGAQPLTLPEDGTYIVRVYDRSLNDVGDYTLSYSCETSPELTCGDNISTGIDATGEFDIYTFEGAVDDVVSLVLANASDIEARFDLFIPSSPTFPVLIEVSELNNLKLDEAGTYVIRVYDRGFDEVGPYSISFEWLLPSFKRCREVPAIPCGQAMAGSITNLAETQLFSLNGNAGDVVSFLLTNNSAIESRLDLFAESTPEAPLLTAASDLIDATLTTDDTYFVRIYDDGLDESGTYALSFDFLGPPDKHCREFTDLACGTELDGSISTASEVDLFTFDGVTNGTTTIRLTDDLMIDARFDLFAPSTLNVPILADASGINDINLTENGSHVIRIYDARSPDTGNYMLGVTWTTCDCNGNGALDSEEIAKDPSKDQNMNGTLDTCETDDGSNFIRGDVETSGVVDISDPLNTLDFLFTGGFQPPCMDAADADDSGAVDLTDAINTLVFLFLGGFQIPPPGHENCGADPTADPPGSGNDIGCVSFGSCDN